MASAERSFQVSVLALVRNIQNGGNTPENRQEALKLVSRVESDSSKYLYRTYLLSKALEAGWRKLGETTTLDAEVLAPKPEAVGLNVVTSGSKTEVHHLPLAA